MLGTSTHLFEPRRSTFCVVTTVFLVSLVLVYYTTEDSGTKPTPMLSSQFNGASNGSLGISTRTPPEMPDTDTESTRQLHGCNEWFNDTFKDNLAVIANYPRGVADKYMDRLGGHLDKPKKMTSFPVLVTASCSKYFNYARGNLYNIRRILLPKYQDIRIVFYDLGLLRKQRVQLEDVCGPSCEFRDFPFPALPDHVRNLKMYAWKPVIVQKTIMEFGFVLWMDSSVRFRKDTLESSLNFTKTTGVLVFTHRNFISSHTDLHTMRYLGEDSCKFRKFTIDHASFGIFYFNVVSKIVINAWAACALNVDCIAPPGSQKKLDCRKCGGVGHADGCCHRFDQSILGILLRRLYHDSERFPPFLQPVHELHRE